MLYLSWPLGQVKILERVCLWIFGESFSVLDESWVSSPMATCQAADHLPGQKMTFLNKQEKPCKTHPICFITAIVVTRVNDQSDTSAVMYSKVLRSSSGPVPVKTHSRLSHVLILQQIQSHKTKKKAHLWLDARKANIVIVCFCPVWRAEGVHARPDPLPLQNTISI